MRRRCRPKSGKGEAQNLHVAWVEGWKKNPELKEQYDEERQTRQQLGTGGSRRRGGSTPPFRFSAARNIVAPSTYRHRRSPHGFAWRPVFMRAGHASVAITLDAYSHLIPGLQEDAANRIDAALRPHLENGG